MSAKRASTRTAGVAAAAAALVLGLFAASAVGWYDEETPPPATTPTETTPPETTPPETTLPETTLPEEQPPPIGETQPPGLAPVSSGVLAAPPEEAVPVPALTAPPEQGVRGEFATRDEGRTGGAKPTVLAQVTDVGAPESQESQESQSTGRLAQTGFDVLILAILGGVALAGSSLLFWRSRTA